MIESITAIHFGRALVKHLGLDEQQVSSDLTLHTKGDDIFGVTLTIMLDGSDIEEIGRIMQGKHEPVNIQPAVEVWLHGKKLERVVAFGEDAKGKWVQHEMDTTTVHNPDLEFRPAGDAPAEKPDFRPPNARRALSAQEMIEKGTKITNKRMPL